MSANVMEKFVDTAMDRYNVSNETAILILRDMYCFAEEVIQIIKEERTENND